MKIRSSKDQPKNTHKAVNKILGATQDSYRSFKDYVRFNEHDSLWLLACKLGLHFVGIIIMIILSPFVLLGLTLAFAAVL